MGKFVIVGAGATGRSVASALADHDAEVFIVSRSGAGGDLPRVKVAAGNVIDQSFLRQVTHGADAIFNCANPPYHRWLQDWPSIAESLLDAAQFSGAVLVTLSNLYAYGASNGPMRPSDPLISTLPKAQVRARMWRDALAAHERGDIRATEVRASDFIGAGSQSFFERGKKSLLANKSIITIGAPDVPHSWTYTGDVGRTLVAAATNPVAWGRPWHAVTNEPLTMREVFDQMATAATVGPPKLRTLPNGLVRVLGIASPQLRELPKVAYQFESPFIIDDSETREALRLEPTPWRDVIANAILH